jgi:hypothetical protein
MAASMAAHQLELELLPPEQAKQPRPRAAAEGPEGDDSAARRSLAAQLLATPGALLTRSHLRALGLERRAIDAVFRSLPVVALPGYSRPMIQAERYLELLEQHTYRDDRVRPCHG